MKRLLLPILLSLALTSSRGLSADSSWTNFGTYNYTNNAAESLPPIDATNVVNFGTIRTATALPFETFHTLNYLNSGLIAGTIGFRFIENTDTGQQMAASFTNFNSGVVAAGDAVLTLDPNNPGSFLSSRLLPSYLIISA